MLHLKTQNSYKIRRNHRLWMCEFFRDDHFFKMMVERDVGWFCQVASERIYRRHCTQAFLISHFSSRFHRMPRLFLKRPCRANLKCAGKDETSPRSKARRSKHNFFISAPHPVFRALFPCLRLDVLACTRKNCRPSGEKERRVTFLARGISFVRETLE